jgi:hypothetical protein
VIFAKYQASRPLTGVLDGGLAGVVRAREHPHAGIVRLTGPRSRTDLP